MSTMRAMVLASCVLVACTGPSSGTDAGMQRHDGAASMDAHVPIDAAEMMRDGALDALVPTDAHATTDSSSAEDGGMVGDASVPPSDASSGDPDCRAFVDCLAACAGDLDCIEGCGSLATPELQALLEAIATCSDESMCDVGSDCFHTMCGDVVTACCGAPTCFDVLVPPSDGGTLDGCVPESTSAFCSRLGAECGSVTAEDSCGTARTEDCGSCTAPETCGGGSAGANACGCDAPPDVTSLSTSCGGDEVRVTFSGTGSLYHYLYRASSAGTPPPCGPGDTALVGTPGFNSFTLAGGPGLNECGTYRICQVDDACDTADSPGRLIDVCVDSVGMLTCTVM